VPQVEQGLKTFIDTFISEFLQNSTPSLTLRVFLQSFGPVGAANFIEQKIVRDGDFVLINGIRYLIDTTGDVAIAKILFDTTMPRVAAAIGGALGGPVAWIVAGLVAAGGATLLWNNVFEPALHAVEDFLGIARAKIELANSSNNLSVGVTYDAGLNGLSEVDAIRFLISKGLDWAFVTPDAGLFVQFYLDGNKTTSYDILKPGLMNSIAESLGITNVSTVENWSWAVSASGQAALNKDLFANTTINSRSYRPQRRPR
jgi:hypothetical protein